MGTPNSKKIVKKNKKKIPFWGFFEIFFEKFWKIHENSRKIRGVRIHKKFQKTQKRGLFLFFLNFFGIWGHHIFRSADPILGNYLYDFMISQMNLFVVKGNVLQFWSCSYFKIQSYNYLITLLHFSHFADMGRVSLPTSLAFQEGTYVYYQSIVLAVYG